MENYRPERSERKVAKVFMSGRSQAVRLPKEYRMPGDEVYVEKVGDQLILSPKVKTLEDLFAGLPLLTDDFPDEIPDLPLQERDAL
ncbi:MAG: antitoxin [SAR202 cluster bacterium]|nr:antitoxin [SAR202 cluster bacterium]